MKTRRIFFKELKDQLLYNRMFKKYRVAYIRSMRMRTWRAKL